MYILFTYRIIVEEVLCIILLDETLHVLLNYDIEVQHFVFVKKL